MDKCPFCGKDCGKTDWHFCRPQCYQNQIARLQEHLIAAENLHHQCCKDNARLHEKLEAWRAWYKTILVSEGDEDDKLKELGEI